MKHRGDLERSTIVDALRSSGGNIQVAADELGASRRTLQNRMRQYGMPRGRAGRRRRALPYARRSRIAAGALAVGAALVGALVYATVKHRGSSA